MLSGEIMSSTNSAETRDRTGDLQIFSLTLSQLSYRGIDIFMLQGRPFQRGLFWFNTRSHCDTSLSETQGAEFLSLLLGLIFGLYRNPKAPMV